MKHKKQFEAGFFVISNIVGGVLHYLYQVVGVKRLDPVSFGQITSWMAYAALGFSVGLLAQSAANFFPQSSRNIKIQSFLFLTLSLLVTWLSLNNELSVLQHTIAGMFLFALFGWLNGQCQTQKLFWVMGITGLAVGLIKLMIVVMPTQVTMNHFYWGYTLNSVIGVILISAVFFFRSKGPSHTPTDNVQAGLLSATLLAFNTMFIPQFDILYVSRTQDSQTIAEFAQVALIYRGIFFFILIFAQWLLPNQIQSGPKKIDVKENRKRVGIALVGGVVLAALAALLGPPLAKQILGLSLGQHPWWIFLSTVHVSILTILFLRIQKDCASMKLRLAFFQTLAMAIGLTIMIFAKLPVTTYLAAMCMVHLSVLALGIVADERVT